MTAEVAIMNKEAVALAADSAVTVRQAGGQKIFTSANKIFSLSKYHPVGLMVYGSASFMGVPWETVVKLFRLKLGKKKFAALSEYTSAFRKFLVRGDIFTKSEQEDHFRRTIHSYFRHIREEIQGNVDAVLRNKGKVTTGEVNKITAKVIEDHRKRWIDAERIPRTKEIHAKRLIEKRKKVINEIKKDIFEKLSISITSSKKLTEIAANLFLMFPVGIAHYNRSGVVVAGFGEKDIFPSLQSIIVEGVLDGLLKYKEDRSSVIDSRTRSIIMSFAQGEMVAAFMEGIDPDYEGEIRNFLTKVLTDYPKVVADTLKKLSTKEKKGLEAKLLKEGVEILKRYEQEFKEYRAENYSNPVVRVVSVLPKDELASMAESLVSLTSFKKRVSIKEEETVGGPIDVAVISRGDGFIWVKRKRYFDPQLNPHFMARYRMEESDEQEK